MSNEDRMNDALREATKIIDELYRLRPPREKFNELATEAYRVIHNVASLDPDRDRYAEEKYQFGRLSELAGETRVFPDYEFRLSKAKEYYEKAVEYSKQGSRKKLAFYEAELVRFRREYPHV